MEEMEIMETAAAAMAEMAVAMTETAVAMTKTACQRGCWPISSIPETRIIWNITLTILNSHSTMSSCFHPH
jgi:hypothetical protein